MAAIIHSKLFIARCEAYFGNSAGQLAVSDDIVYHLAAAAAAVTFRAPPWCPDDILLSMPSEMVISPPAGNDERSPDIDPVYVVIATTFPCVPTK
jgi:hypothetical protein